jgi:hypothetical protein
MYQTITFFLLSLVLAAAMAIIRRPLRGSLISTGLWLTALAIAGTLSAASAIVASTRRAGTGFTTSHGWPKPFYFRYSRESGEVSHGWDLLYFIGNSLVFAGVVIVLWSLWQFSRRQRSTP